VGNIAITSDLSRRDSPATVRYPDPDIVALDHRFQRLVLGNARIERVSSRKRNQLFMASSHSLCSLYVETQGA